MNMGIIGAIIGTVIGIAGGIIGTYFSIKSTNGPRERAFMVKSAVVGWIAITIFLLMVFYLPSPYRYLMWVVYGVSLPLAIFYGNKRQAKIREQEKEIRVPTPSSKILLDKAGFSKVFSPIISGIYLTEQLSRRFLEGLVKRIESGLFPKAVESRNRYVVSSRTEEEVKFHSIGLKTSVYVGLNDVSVKIDSSPNTGERVIWRVKYWKWAMYSVKVCFFIGGLLILTRFLLFPAWFNKWWCLQPKCLHGLLGEVLFWFFIIFWGLLWPWVLVVLHKRPVSNLLRYIFDEVNQSQIEVASE